MDKNDVPEIGKLSIIETYEKKPENGTPYYEKSADTSSKNVTSNSNKDNLATEISNGESLIKNYSSSMDSSNLPFDLSVDECLNFIKREY
jgi:hypothetical protein